jgi:hypothetical protein
MLWGDRFANAFDGIHAAGARKNAERQLLALRNKVAWILTSRWQIKIILVC